MKTSLAWLNSYLGPSVELQAAADIFTALGFPTEKWDPAPGGDWLLDVEITSNRPDLLSHVGLARELAAATGRQLRGPNCALPPAAAGPVEALAKVRNQELELCPVYTARVIRGVKVGPSPQWLVERLQAVGLRSVNNVVDVTNFVLLELGQPLHAFDLNLLDEKTIVVRRAKAGEAFAALDGSNHKLTERMLVIADARKPVALAGVMGGSNSEVGPTTTDVLLESAMFAPLQVRQTSRALKLFSDSSYRFERGIDPAGVELASRRAAQLIVELAGGKLAEGVIRAGQPEATQARTVQVRVARCAALLGVAVPAERMVELLGRLGLAPRLDQAAGTIACTIPTHRLDLEREVDLIEEVIRLHGLSHVPFKEKIELVAQATNPKTTARRGLRQVLVAHGFHETVNFSFVSPRCGQPFLPAGHEAVEVDDERRKSEPMLRPSLLPSLLACRKFNQDAGNRQVRLFETASVWSKAGGKIVESQKLAILMDVAGNSPADLSPALRELRGVLAELVERLGGTAALTLSPATWPCFAAASGVALADQPIGWIGVVDAKIQALFDLQTPVVAAEVELEPLLALFPPQRKVTSLAKYPAIERDLSVVVAEDVPWAQIEKVLADTPLERLESSGFVGVYRGKPIEAGKKSVTFRLIFRDPQTTLRHEQVDPQVRRVVAKLHDSLGAVLRA
ncbi:MAG: phenylalanine--tRNA ligase subunit beta [Phycisphaeraceae bacterium]|nr:phenylalanine--tRNA ligase subunit beta [Phycisphaeraceae bacterium]